MTTSTSSQQEEAAGAVCRACGAAEVRLVPKAGLRGWLERRCGACGVVFGLPQPAKQTAASRRMTRDARWAERRRAGTDVVGPSVPPPRRRNGWTPDLGVPRGERD